jgi:hypothetical protein
MWIKWLESSALFRLPSVLVTRNFLRLLFANMGERQILAVELSVCKESFSLPVVVWKIHP